MRLKFLAPVLLLLPVFLSAESTVLPDGTIVITGPRPDLGPSATAPAKAPTRLPAKGLSKSAVQARFGQPGRKHPPVGGATPKTPPITRWDYANFSVFFEHNHVVDSVQHGNPAPIAVYDGLSGGPR